MKRSNATYHSQLTIHHLPLYRKAFTMIELIFVIVVVGILAIVMIPRFDRDNILEATHQVLSDIRYAQHLAMMDNRFEPSDEFWYQERWRIWFHNDGNAPSNNHEVYTIFSDEDHGGNADLGEIATDPVSLRKMTGDDGTYPNDFIESMNLTANYGVLDVDFSTSCGANQYVAFDNIGRSYQVTGGVQMYDIITSDCNITLKFDTDKNATITIVPETGYAYVAEINR